MAIINMTDLALEGRRVLIRQDLNVPIDNGEVVNDTRIRAGLPTVEHAIAAGASVMLMSHLGRPEEGRHEERYSLAPVAGRLGELLACEVRLVKDWLQGADVDDGELVLCENVRFNVGEGANDEFLCRQMASLCGRICHGCVWHRSPSASLDPWRRQICPDRLRRSAAER